MAHSLIERNLDLCRDAVEIMFMFMSVV